MHLSIAFGLKEEWGDRTPQHLSRKVSPKCHEEGLGDEMKTDSLPEVDENRWKTLVDIHSKEEREQARTLSTSRSQTLCRSERSETSFMHCVLSVHGRLSFAGLLLHGPSIS